MARKVGVTIGKFLPLHQGHELMIEMAASLLDELIVIVSSADYSTASEYSFISSLDLRYRIIKRKYAGRNITVVKHIDEIGDPVTVDQHGTATDPDFWNYWINVFEILAPDATHFVSSDHYGDEAAQRMDIMWMPIDPDRELVDISATKIRSDPMKYWKYIAREFREYYVKKVVVIGAESTGKSTLVKDLGAAWGSPAVPEYGRTMAMAITKSQNAWSVDDFKDIVHRQQAMNRQAAQMSETGLIFIDTEAYTTYLYCVEYLDTHSKTLHRYHNTEWFDLVVLVLPNIPWVDDGTRLSDGAARRDTFTKFLRDEFRIPKNTNTIELAETDRQLRVDVVSAAVNEIVLQVEQKEYSAMQLTTLPV